MNRVSPAQKLGDEDSQTFSSSQGSGSAVNQDD